MKTTSSSSLFWAVHSLWLLLGILKAVKNWCFCHRFKRWLTAQWIWSSSVKINTRLSGTAYEICAVATDVSEGNALSVVPIFVLSWWRDAPFLEGTWVTSREFLSCGISSQSACILFYLYIVSHLWFLWTWFPGGRASFDSQPILRSSVILFYVEIHRVEAYLLNLIELIPLAEMH